MFPDETSQRQKKLSDEIFELSKKVLDNQQNEHLEVIHRLQMIYKDNFKHSYSDFFPVLSKIFEENNEFNDEFLVTNLQTIRTELEEDYSTGKHQYVEIYGQFTKLCDHLNLQISQMTFFTSTTQKFNDARTEMFTARTEMQEAQKNLTEAQDTLDNTLEKVNKQIKSLQTELIAVLSIFAAIVITFSGGFTYLGSVMTSINEAKCFEMILLTAIICGIVIFNTIFMMMYFVAKIIEKNIYVKCLISDCSCDNPKHKCNAFKRTKNRLPYVFYFNLVAIVGIIVDCLVWFCDIKGILL